MNPLIFFPHFAGQKRHYSVNGVKEETEKKPVPKGSIPVSLTHFRSTPNCFVILSCL